MNTNPDEATLALWLDDELTGEELSAVEAWAAGQPDQLAARDEVRRWRAMLSAALPAVEEPPFPDFFNSRVMQGIRDSAPKPVTAKPMRFRNWLMPLAACAGMALTFWIGKESQRPVEPVYNVAGAPRAIPVDPLLYTPEKGVDAEWFASDNASATVIVLNGVAAIPDSTDFSATVMIPTADDIDFTADSGANPAPFKN